MMKSRIPGGFFLPGLMLILFKKRDVNVMDKHIFKRILLSLGQGLRQTFAWMIKNKQVLVFVFLLVAASLYFVYTLGYSTNWALIVSETRGARFYRASQTANRLMSQLGFILVIVVLLNMGFGSMSRKKYYFSNIVLSILSSILILVSSVINLYYNSVLRPMYANISEEEVPAYLYTVHGAGQKSYQIFELGNILSIFMIISGLLVIWFLIYKVKAQHERAKLIEKLVNANER